MNILRWSRISIVLFLSLCVLSPGKVADGQTVAADNVLTVRAIYQKLSNAIQMQQLRELVLSSKPASPDEATTPPSIILSDIVAGNMSDILNTSYADLVTKPSGAVLAVSPGVWRYTLKNGQQSTAEIASADWTTEPYLAEDWIQPMERVIAQGSIDSSYVSYVSAAVSLSYAGAARQYKALFLFGPGTGSQPKVLPLDQIIGVSQLLAILNAPSTPDPLAYEPFHSRPITQRFLTGLQAPASCTSDSRTHLCCSSATGQCGVPQGDLEVHGVDRISALTGIRPACTADCGAYNTTGSLLPYTSGGLTNDHTSGSHSGSMQLQGTCTYSGTSTPCTGVCHVHVIAPSTTETGITKLYLCHARATNTNGSDTEGTTACTGSWGFAAVGCGLCTCAGTVSVGLPGPGGSSVSVSYGGSGTALNTWGWGLTYGGCPTMGQ